MLVALYFVFAPLMRTWPFRGAEPLAADPSHRRTEGRIGLDAAPGSYTDVSKATFGEGLDAAIKNNGEVDASEADFK